MGEHDGKHVLRSMLSGSRYFLRASWPRVALWTAAVVAVWFAIVPAELRRVTWLPSITPGQPACLFWWP